MQNADTRAQPGILFVDDEVKILKALTRLFKNEPVDVHVAETPRDAFHALETQDIHVVISDQRMPGACGAQVLSQIRKNHPKVVRMMLTGYTEIDVAVQAINQGEIFRLITKPWNDEELKASVRQACDTFRLSHELDRLNELTHEQNRKLQEMNRTLEATVADRTREVREKHKELRLAYVSTVGALAEAIDAKDPYTRGHSERVGVYSSRIARQLGCENPFIERIYLAGLLHDIGKIGVPDAIISKPDKLTDEEYDQIKRHPEIGARILEPVSFLADIVPCVRHHHEWYDGSNKGYPDQLSGGEIPYPSRIILVADTCEAMTSDRPYRKGLPVDKVIDEIQRFSGTQFDPTVVDAFLSIFEREREDFLEQASKFDIQKFLTEAS